MTIVNVLNGGEVGGIEHASLRRTGLAVLFHQVVRRGDDSVQRVMGEVKEPRLLPMLADEADGRVGEVIHPFVAGIL